MVFFSFGFTPLQGLYPAEVLTFENRAKGLSLQAWVTSLCSLINTFGLPPALGAINFRRESRSDTADISLLYLLRVGRCRLRRDLVLCCRDQAFVA